MDYIYEIECSLPPTLCERMIELFELDDRKQPGITMKDLSSPEEKSEKKHKISTDLHLSRFTESHEWGNVDKVLKCKLTEGLKKYLEHLENHCKSKSIEWESSLRDNFRLMIDSGYQIQRTTKGGYYNWHHDMFQTNERTITFIWYLNTLDPNVDGGTTDFECGKSIVPKQGKLVFFPATWTYLHRGSPVLSDNTKYICTGWIHDKKI